MAERKVVRKRGAEVAGLQGAGSVAPMSDAEGTDSEDEEEFGWHEDGEGGAGAADEVDAIAQSGLQLIPASRDFSWLSLRPDSTNRPIWVAPNRRIYLDVASPFYKQASDFLVAVSEPICRPEHIHEYQLTPFSLYAAASLGLETQHIIGTLNRLSKVEVPEAVVSYIKEHTEQCGKAKMVLRKMRYFVESIYPEVLQLLLADEVVAAARIDHLSAPQRQARLAKAMPESKEAQAAAAQQQQQEAALQQGIVNLGAAGAAPAPGTMMAPKARMAIAAAGAGDKNEQDLVDEATGLLIASLPEHAQEHLVLPGTGTDRKIDLAGAVGLAAEDLVASHADRPVLAFEVEPAEVERVRERCITELKYPLLEEYDFKRDNSSPDLPELKLKPTTRIREYQEKSLSKMFGNGRARSGIIVLPCGAGKTLVGITAAATVRKSTLVFCTTAVAVDQWKRQFLMWTELPERKVAMFTANIKDKLPSEGGLVIITTYNMIAHTGQRSRQGAEAMKFITSHEWGLVVLDEVHVAPANQFRKAVSLTHSRCKLGLTATLVREDNLINDLFFLLGPKLYEANWLDLQESGFIATVQCVEVWCPMTSAFYQAYLNASHEKQRLLYVMNPNKFRICEYLIRIHEERGDKVLVFSDNVYALREYAWALGKPLIYGATPNQERLEFLKQFQYNPKVNTLFISKVGDNSIDLPDVNVIIQISSHFASRRQEAQRLGRILRPKSKSGGRFNAFFYTLVTTDTQEMVYAGKRQRFLVDQGYAFKVVTSITDLDTRYPDLAMSTEEQQTKLLMKVTQQDDSAGALEHVEDDPFDHLEDEAKTRKAAAVKKKTSMAALTGADSRAYAEFQAREDARKAASSKAKSSGRRRPGGQPSSKKARKG